MYTISNIVNGNSKPIRKGGFRTKGETRIRKRIMPHLAPVLFDGYFKKWVEDYKSHVNENTKKRYLTTLETIKEEFDGIYITGNK